MNDFPFAFMSLFAAAVVTRWMWAGPGPGLARGAIGACVLGLLGFCWITLLAYGAYQERGEIAMQAGYALDFALFFLPAAWSGFIAGKDDDARPVRLEPM